MNKVLLLITSVCSFSLSIHAQTLAELAESGDKEYSAGNYTKAVEFYNLALEKDTANIDFMTAYRCGLAYDELQNYPQALEQYKNSLIKGYFETDIYKKMKTDAESMSCADCLEKIYIEVGEKNQMMKPMMAEKLFYVYSKKKQNKEALNCAHQVLEYNPENFAILKNAGYIYNTMSKSDSALYYLEKAVAINESDATLNKALGYLYYNVCTAKQENENKVYEKSKKDHSSYNTLMYNRQSLARNYYPKALHYFKASQTIKADAEVSKMITRLEEAYEAYKK